MLDLDKKAGVLRKTTLVDYPGHVACAFFLSGCNLKCPYCYNTGLVLSPTPEDIESFSTINELFSLMEKRKALIQGIAISGGEPLINHYTPLIIKKAKELGLHVKIDTNGINPEILETFLKDESLRPDFVAMDFKTSPERYSTEMITKDYIHFGDESFFEEKLQKTLNLLDSMGNDSYEIRTVLVPKLVTEEDIKNMAKIIPTNASWQFAPFRNENCIDPEFNLLRPYSILQLESLVDYAKTFIPNAKLR